MNLLLVCATRTETTPLRQLLNDLCWTAGKSKRDSCCWKSDRHTVRMLRTGVGGDAAFATELGWLRSTNHFVPDSVVIFGLAGQIDPALHVGTISIPSVWQDEHSTGEQVCSELLLDCARSTQDPDIRVGGTGVTLGHPAWTSEERACVLGRFPDAAVCDLETHSVMQHFPKALRLGLRIVSDDANTASAPERARKPGLPSHRTTVEPPPLFIPEMRALCDRLAEFVVRFIAALD